MKNLYPGTSVLTLLVLGLLLSTCSRKAEAVLYPTASDGTYNFPETYLMPKDRPLTGVCFSGGGTRAMACAIGQMKALDSLNLWPQVDYISSVSGGSWASSIYTYYEAKPGGPQNDKDLLGYPKGAGNLTLANLEQQIPTKHMAHVVTNDFTEHIAELLAEDVLTLGIMEKANDIWIDAVGKTYLEPFGLYGGEHKYFTLDAGTRDGIIIRNEDFGFKKEDFHLVHTGENDAPRPYLVMNSCVISPSGYFPLEMPVELTVFNYTPLGVGAAKFRKIIQKTDLEMFEYPVGGGFIEPFAFGGTAPIAATFPCDDDKTCATVKLRPKHAFRIADAAGTSSSAYAVEVAEHLGLEIPTDILALGSIVPKVKYWPVNQANTTKAEAYRFGDGGSLENFGIISLLQRDVTKLLVFINTNTKIDTTFNPATDSIQYNTIDYDFFTLFDGYTYENHIHNHIFSKADFINVFGQFKDSLSTGGNVMAVLNTTTLPNEWWGVDAKEVEVHFYYNDRSSTWESELDSTIQAQINLKMEGVFRDFPWYRTAFPDYDELLVELSPAMTKLLYEFQFWNVYRNEEGLRKLFGDN